MRWWRNIECFEKKKGLVFKIDFVKAHDMIVLIVLFSIFFLGRKGFGKLWRK